MTVSWFGGEPLLALDVIKEISEEIIEWAAAYGVTYQAEISTNGYYLSKETMQTLLAYGVNRVMVTLDGTKEVHDTRRILATGGPTYETILQNLRAIQALEEPFEIYIRVNFDEDNLAQIPPFLTESFFR